jgi:hypothetical protein
LRGFLRQVKVFSHTRLTTCLGLLCFALLAFVAPSAMAESCNAPPGTSGIDQYCETIPTPGHGGGSHHKGDGSKTRHLSPATTQTLKQSGASGAAVLALTGAAGDDTAAPAKKELAKRHHRKSHKGSGSTHAPSTTATPAPVRDTTPAADTSFSAGNSISGSLGGGLIGLLAAVAGVFGLVAWFGRRRPDPGASAES